MDDGKVTISTALDNSGVEQDGKETVKVVEQTAKESAKAAGQGAKQAADAAAQSGKSIRSQVMSLAHQYKKQGMSMSDAMKQAYKDLGYTAKSSTKGAADGIESDFGSAVSAVSGKLGGLTKVIKTLAASVASAFAVKKIAEFVKTSVDAYTDYEQLVGGVETLFKDSAAKVTAYAEDAFYTVGLSANAYMQTVTSFSASLISSLGGDTDRAADVANMALVDMADNANKMGTEMASIQNAYQGFAKQNYTLLDNLKLGYGGTKTEMERLLKDAQALTGVKYNIDNLADVYNAIHAIQGKLGITGTTALEAEKTISGSANMTKAAWKNVLAAISGGGDLDKAINNLVYSISKYFENIVPVVQRAIAGIGELIEKIAPSLVQNVAIALIKALPSLLHAVYQMILGLAKGIYQGIAALLSGQSFAEPIKAQLNSVADSAGSAADAEKELASGIKEADKAAKASLAGFDELNRLQDSAESAESTGLPGMPDGTVPGAGGILEKDMALPVEDVFSSVKTAVSDFCSWFQKAMEPSISAWGGAWDKMGQSVSKALPRIRSSVNELWDKSLGPLVSKLVGEFIPNVSNSFSEAFAPIIGGVVDTGISVFADTFEWASGIISDAVNNVILPALGLLESIWTGLMEGITNMWNTYGQPILDGVSQAFQNLMGIFTTLWETVIKPIYSNLIEVLSALWEEHLKPLFDKLAMAVGSVVNCLLSFWNNVLAPIVNWLVGVFGPYFSTVFNSIVNIVGTAFGIISDAVGVVIDVFIGICDFLANVFSGDWGAAWDAIKNMFSNVWDGIVGILKGCVNLMSGIINSVMSAMVGVVNLVIRALNTINVDVPEWVPLIGGSHFGFSIKELEAPQIPKLAQGAVLPANKPFLAMVGDQSHGTNVEAPLSTIQEAVALVMEDFAASNMAGHEATVAVLREILEAVLGISIDDDMIFAAANRARRKQAIMTGGNA